MRGEDSEIIFVFVSAAGAILIMALLIAFFVSIYQKRLLKQDQHLQRLETDYQKGLLQATIDGQERERKRLAKDLHDGIGSLLTGLNLNIKHQLHIADPKSQQARFLSEACGMLEEGIGEVRRVSHNLLPITLESFGLVPAIQEWKEILEKDSFIISMKINGDSKRLSPRIELGLLRVMQELMQNTIKHAEAKSSELNITFLDISINLDYSDNGKGYDSSLRSHGIGIKNIQSRIEALNGTLTIKTGPNQGFNAQIKVPIYSENGSNNTHSASR